eukprot:4238040-Alexandrium_andersonii.AAC.1
MKAVPPERAGVTGLPAPEGLGPSGGTRSRQPWAPVPAKAPPPKASQPGRGSEQPVTGAAVPSASAVPAKA